MCPFELSVKYLHHHEPVVPGLRHMIGSTIQLNRFAIGVILAGVLLSIAVVYQNVVVTGAAIVMALASVLPIEVALGTFAFLIPFDYVLAIGTDESPVRVTWLAGAFAGGVLLIYGFASERLGWPPRQAWWWALFMFWVGLSTAWTIDPALSLNRLPSIVTLLGLYLITVSFRLTSRELSRVMACAVGGGVVAAALLIYQASRAGLHAPTTHYVMEGRGALVFGGRERDPNELGASLVLPFTLAFAGVLSYGSLAKRIALLIALSVLASAIFLTMSRGALIALAVAVLVLLYRGGVRKRVLLSLVLVAVPLLFVPDLFYERLMEAPSGRGTGRLDIVLVGLQIIKHNPVLGTGLATFPLAHDQYVGYAKVFHGYTWNSHDAYLQAWAETGVIGFVLLLIAIVSQVKTIRAALRAPPLLNWSGVAVEAAWWGVLVYGFSGDLEFNKYFWFILMLLGSMARARHATPIYRPEEMIATASEMSVAGPMCTRGVFQARHDSSRDLMGRA